MIKGCIVTLNDNNNLGNRLQNYALQKYLEKFNIDSDTLWYKNRPTYIKKVIEIVKYFILFITAPFFTRNKERLLKRKRYKNITNFTNKYIKCRKVVKNEASKIENYYDIFIFGSDQIWHPYALEHNDYIYGDYITNKKKISYAASLAVDKLDTKFNQKLRNSLLSFEKITVREEKGKQILENLISEKNIDVVVDPTMLLQTDEWNKILKKPKRLEGKYILTYFLGQLSDERKKEIKRVAEEYNCTIINILDPKSEFYTLGPEEFLYLEKNAFLICTDSFHSCVFAILFNRPFLVYDREDSNQNMNSRMETLLEKFELKDRYYTGKISKKDLKVDFSNINDILEKERDKSERIIKEVIKTKH